MTKYKMSPSEFIAKCEWEGGGVWQGFEYGLNHNDLSDKDKAFKNKIKKMYLMFKKFKDLEDTIDYEALMERYTCQGDD